MVGMESFVGVNVKLRLKNDKGIDLFFTAMVDDVDENSISFTDKYGKKYIFPVEWVKQMEEE